MKKFFYLFFIVAAFLTFSVSCSKAEQDTEIDNPSEEKPVPQDATKIRFNISLASEGGKATIASDGNVANVTWNTGDQVTVYAVNDEGVQGKETVTVSINHDDNTKAVIETVLPAGCTYYAAFPKCESATFNGDVMTVSEPAAATAQTNSNNQVAVSKAEKIGGGSYSLQFKNVNHLLKFTVSKTLAGTVKSAELVSQTSGGAVSYDKVSYNFANGTSTKAGSEVTSLKRTVVEGDNFIALAPGVTMSGGFCLKLKDNNGKVVKLFFLDKKFTTERNGGSNISNFETKLYTNLSKDGTANCYLINPADGSKFCFDAKKKGASTTSIATEKVEHLWSTVNTSTAPGNNTTIISGLKYHSATGYASFDKKSTGNVVVAAKKSDGTILWSWHLWLPITEVKNVKHDRSAKVGGTTYTMNGQTMLDRNLGALTGEYDGNNTKDRGFFYQWGRKDPFVGSVIRLPSSSTSANNGPVAVCGPARGYDNKQHKVAWTIENPTTFIIGNKDWASSSNNNLWAAEKTMYDPCPVGYFVPDSNQGPFGNFSKLTSWANDRGRSFVNKAGTTVWFPACGFLAYDTGQFNDNSLPSKIARYWFHYNDNTTTAYSWEWQDTEGSVLFYSCYRATGCVVRCQKQ